MHSNTSRARKVALLATTALALALAAAPVANAQSGNKPAQVAQAEQTKSFAIPSGSLNDALAAFRLQSGLQVSADPAALRGVSSPGATGSMTPGEALSHVFAGTKFTYAVDAFAETRVTDNINLKLYAQNLFDKTYYDGFYQSAQPFIMVAPGRTISLIADVKF